MWQLKHLKRLLTDFGESVSYENSGGWKCAIVGMPCRGSVSACLVAWGDLLVGNMLKQMLKRLSLLRHHGTPMTAHLQLPEERQIRATQISAIYNRITSPGAISRPGAKSSKLDDRALCIFSITVSVVSELHNWGHRTTGSRLFWTISRPP